ncbi:sensor histidine kinase [Sedimenticola selenatireducens]|uniref:histidine kinase n=1 Tax=Sedimenticola selenatireducens TaxID=191960 RepID=A0A557RY52_9GAMM|nr:ATP-binding protein [Sedimenticola selenatireducens]TVO70085.1 HAMP domain-containing histidine kinase [Sedimenticola selenatireducens]TVT61673.1 MAG: HAMP domain-containing histidine kinase [Sedimenticola selenatireducens]
MLRTLYAKLAAGLVVLFVTIGLLYALISTSATRYYLQEVNQAFNKELARNLVADRNLVAEGRLNQEALKETFHQYMVINPSIEIYLLDLQGKILAYSADPGKVKRNHVSLEPLMTFLGGAESYPLLGDDPRSHDGQKAFSVTPVPTTDHPEGYLYVVLRGEEFDSVDKVVRESYFMRLSGWAVVASLGLGLLAGLIVLRLLTRRLHRLSNLIATFHQSNFTSHQPYLLEHSKSSDEVDQLGATFDQMAEHIKGQLDQLKEQDSLRRKLVAQVSHDLRTPLASMMGYLESLELKGEEMGEPERKEYTGIALRQAKRLSKQVSELFELASLDARETQPNCEPFPPAELVQDVVQKYQLRANQQQIQLSMTPPPALPFVFADIGLTERVLENLIENAFTHTPTNGRIILSIDDSDSGVVIRVTDTGCGIKAEDIPHIFDPFFQSGGKSSAGDHAGLGLAIAKRIMTLQQGDIQVTSALGSGTRFTIILPLAETYIPSD